MWSLCLFVCLVKKYNYISVPDICGMSPLRLSRLISASFYASEVAHPTYTDIVCFVAVLALVSSILTMMLIACDRFFGVVFSMKAYLTDRRAATSIVFVWVCAAGISSPILVYREQLSRTWLDHNEIWCDDTWPTQQVCNTPALPTCWLVGWLAGWLAFWLVGWLAGLDG